MSYLVYRFIGIENDRIQILSDHNESRARRRLHPNISRRMKRSSGWYRWPPSSLLSNDFVRRLPGAHALRGINAKKRASVDSNRNSLRETILVSNFFFINLWWNGIFGGIVLCQIIVRWLWILDVFCSTFLDLPHVSLIDVYVRMHNICIYIYQFEKILS